MLSLHGRNGEGPAPADTRERVGGGERRAAAGKEGVAVDPICGMEVETESARHTLDHEGSTLYFCCPGCREAFAKRAAVALEG